jgi:hypothetical protein
MDLILFPAAYELYRRLFESDRPLVIQGKVDARQASNRSFGGSGGAAPAPVLDDEHPAEVEEPAEQASIVVDFAWHWDDPECVPIERRQVLHVYVPVEEADAVERLTAVLARHPGEDEVFLHFQVDGTDVTVKAGDRYHVAAGPALATEVDSAFGREVAKLVAVRPRAAQEQPRWRQNGNGNGSGYRNGGS